MNIGLSLGRGPDAGFIKPWYVQPPITPGSAPANGLLYQRLGPRLNLFKSLEHFAYHSSSDFTGVQLLSLRISHPGKRAGKNCLLSIITQPCILRLS